MQAARRISWILLAAVMLLCFGIHAVSYPLSGIPEAKRDLFRDEAGEPYLTEMDSYFYLRLAETMAEENRIFLYSRRLADDRMGQRPVENPPAQGDPTLLSILTFCIWKVLRLFSSVTVIQAARWIGPVFASLGAVPAFLYVKRRAGLAGAVTAGLLTGLAIPFLGHTHAGFFDTDCLLALVPLGFVTAHLCSMQEERPGRQALFSLLSGVCFSLLSLLWVAYYTYFWLMVLGGLISSILILCVPFRCPIRRRMKAIRGFGMTAACCLLCLLIVRGTEGIRRLEYVIGMFRSVGGATSAFPFVHQYTGEMQALQAMPDITRSGFLSLLGGSYATLLNRAGGLIPCLLGLAAFPIGILMPMRGRKTRPAAERHAGLIPVLTEAGILPLWLIVGWKMALGSERFAEIVVLPLFLLAGLAAGFTCGLLKNRKAPVRRIAACGLALAACAGTVTGAWTAARKNVPSVSDAKAEAMAWIRENTPENAAVFSWWDDGYYVQYAARRRAPADGGTSSGEVNYFLARALVTDDPTEMTGLLRMLETSGVSALSLLRSRGVPDAEAAELLYWITSAEDREDAADMIAESGTELSPEDRETILDMTHPAEKLPLYLVLGSDILAKLKAVCYFGSWDLAERKQDIDPYWFVSARSQPEIPGTVCTFEMAGRADPLQVRIGEDGTAELIRDPSNMYYGASSLSLWEDGECLQRTETEEEGAAVFLIREGGRLCAFTCSPELADSMLVRLFVCAERDIPGVELAKTCYGADNGDPCPAQSLLNYPDLSAWGYRVWRLAE